MSSVRRWSSRSTRRDSPGTRTPPRTTRRTRRTSAGQTAGWSRGEGLDGGGASKTPHKQLMVFSVWFHLNMLFSGYCHCKYASGSSVFIFFSVPFFVFVFFFFLIKMFQLRQYHPSTRPSCSQIVPVRLITLKCFSCAIVLTQQCL